MAPFNPLFRNPHLQTLAAHFWRRPSASNLPPFTRRLVRTAPDVQVLVESARPHARPRAELVMVHGLESSGQAGYIRSLGTTALRAGFGVHRFHMRTCGGTEHLCQTLYHAGLTSDLAAVMKELGGKNRPPVFLIGYSLGGNVVLKLTGELGEQAPEILAGVCAVSTPLDLAACARRIGAPENRLYQQRFVKRMRARLSATGRYESQELARLSSVAEIDDRFTAPSFGFGNAANYYRTQSAIHFLPSVRVPVLLIQAKDDTFVPFETFESEAVRGNPHIRVIAPDHGGHLGFLGRQPHRFWSDDAIMEWLDQILANRTR